MIFGASVRAAAEDARTSGQEIIAVDLFGDQDTRDICTLWQPLDFDQPAISIESAVDKYRQANHALDSDQPMAVVATGGLESFAEKLACLPSQFFFAGPSWHQIQQLRSPTFLHESALKTDLLFPRSQATLDAPEERSHPENASNQRWLQKRRYSAGGMAVKTVDQQAAKTIPLDPRNDYFQQQVDGQLIGVNFLSLAGRARSLGVVRNYCHRSADHPFLYGGSFGPIKIQNTLFDRITALAQHIVDTTGLVGCFGIDLIADRQSDRCWLLEVNPRYTASMEVLNVHSQQSFIALHLAAYLSHNMNQPNRSAITAAVSENLQQHQKAIAKALTAGKVACKHICWATDAMVWTKDLQRKITSSPDVAIADVPILETQIPGNSPIVSLRLTHGNSMSGTNSVSVFRSLRQLRRFEQDTLCAVDAYSKHPSKD